MSRRIAYVFAIAACAAFVAPASADRECFDNTCRMPEVTEAPEAPAATADEPKATAEAAPQGASPPPAPEPIRPQMAVDALPRPGIEPLAKRPIEGLQKPVRQAVREIPRTYEASDEPVEPVGGRQYTAEPSLAYAPHQARSYPAARVVVVVPGVQYGADGVALEQGRQDSSWELCQSDRRANGRCGPYNYQPFGAYGYRPLGSHRPYRPVSTYVYVPGAKVITIEGN